MKYQSTRGKVKDLTFEQALLSGYLSDGGIALPQEIPKISTEEMKSWAKLSYTELIKKIVPYFVGDEIPPTELDALLDKAFKSFSCPEVAKLQRLSEELNILELFHGPTLAFKDLALGVVGQLLEYFLNKRRKHIIIIVGTSGDTGSAAIESVRGLKWVDIIVLLPRGRTSRIQELQMTTVIEDNVHVYRVDASSDDLDIPIKAVFVDDAFAATHNLCSINSINWARVMAQTAHHFYAYFQMCPDVDREVEIVIPTGACGNVTSGLIAVEMGLPAKFVCAVNKNDTVARAINHGDYSVPDDVIPSLAPAMDIAVAYNMERIIHLLSGSNGDLVRAMMEEFETSNKSTLPRDILTKIQNIVQAYAVSDEGIKSAMVQCWQKNQYLLCPHTAVAAKYHYDHRINDLPRVCVATASPAKFEEAVTSAGLKPQPTEAIKKLDKMETKYIDMEKGEDFEKILRNKIVEITNTRK